MRSVDPGYRSVATAPSPTSAGGRKTVAEATGEPAPKAVRKSVVEMMESLHNDDRRGEAKEPWRARPIGKKVGIEIIHRIRRTIRIWGIRRRRNRIDLLRQSRGILRDPPAAVGLRA